MQGTEDPYGILGVDRGSSEDDIKKAYRKLALKLHPDKNPDEDPETFKRVTRAYGILSDPERKKKYDMFGVVDDSGNPGSRSAHGFPDFPTGVNPFQDIFGQMFGGMGGGGPGVHIFHMSSDGSSSRRGPSDIQVSVSVNLAELRKGCIKKLIYEAKDLCEACKGTGAMDPAKDIINCITCGGRGVVMQQIFPPFASEITCPGCQGKGKMVKAMRTCMSCRGACLCTKSRTVDVTIPPSTMHGQEVRMRGQGHASVHPTVRSDLVVNIQHVLPRDHRVDLASGDVYMPLHLDVRDLFCGFDVVVTPYGNAVRVHAETGYINPCMPQRIPGMGLPKPSADSSAQNGDLVLEFKVSFPNEVPNCAKCHDILCKVFKRGSAQQAHADSVDVQREIPDHTGS